MIWPVIMCGGSGTRLWPASRADRPKQFLPLIGDRSSFQRTLLRVADLEEIARVVVVTGSALADLVREQAMEVGVETVILVEPEARDSAPAAAAAAAYVREQDDQGVVLLLAADHHIERTDLFRAACLQAARGAREGYIVTFGLTPTHPATGFGYIRPGAPLFDGVARVESFVEKPDLATARLYLQDGYLWNSGNFAFTARSLFEELEKHEPGVGQGALLACANAVETDGMIFLDEAGFSQTTKISLDFAVMERTDRAAVVAAAFDWSDLGAWSAIWSASSRDPDGNAVQGDTLLLDSSNVLVKANGPFVGVIGVSDLIVVAERDAVLICHTSKDQSVKAMVEALKAAGRPFARQHAAERVRSSVRETIASVDGASTDLVTLSPIGAFEASAGLVVVLNGAVEADGRRYETGSSFETAAGAISALGGPASILITRWSART